MDSEIGFALLHKSIENYCNPRSSSGGSAVHIAILPFCILHFPRKPAFQPVPILFQVESFPCYMYLLWNGVRAILRNLKGA